MDDQLEWMLLTWKMKHKDHSELSILSCIGTLQPHYMLKKVGPRLQGPSLGYNLQTVHLIRIHHQDCQHNNCKVN